MPLTKARLLKHDLPVHGMNSSELFGARVSGTSSHFLSLLQMVISLQQYLTCTKFGGKTEVISPKEWTPKFFGEDRKRVVSKRVVFGRCSPAEKSSKKSFPSVLAWPKKKNVIFDFPGPQKPERRYIPGAIAKTALVQNRTKSLVNGFLSILGRYEWVLRFMGREVKERYTFRMQAVNGAVAKLQGDKTASFCRKMSGREVTVGTPICNALSSRKGQTTSPGLGSSWGWGSNLTPTPNPGLP